MCTEIFVSKEIFSRTVKGCANIIKRCYIVLHEQSTWLAKVLTNIMCNIMDMSQKISPLFDKHVDMGDYGSFYM